MWSKTLIVDVTGIYTHGEQLFGNKLHKVDWATEVIMHIFKIKLLFYFYSSINPWYWYCFCGLSCSRGLLYQTALKP